MTNLVNNGIYTDTDWHFDLAFTDANGAALALPNDYQCDVMAAAGGPVLYAFKSSGAGATDGTITKPVAGTLRFASTEASRTGAISGLSGVFVLHLYDTTDNVWASEGKMLLALPGAPGSYVEFNTATNGATATSTVVGVKGDTGPANSLSIGTVTTAAAGSPAAAVISGTAPTQTLSLTIPAGDAGADGVMTGREVTGASDALAVIPRELRDVKTLALLLSTGSYAATDTSGSHVMGDIAAYVSATITNSTGGSRITRKRLLESVAANSLRLTHDVLGRPMGALIEAAFAYLHSHSQGTVANAYNAANVSDASVSGETGNWLTVTSIGTLANYYLGPTRPSFVSGETYHLQMEVIMADGSAPSPTLLNTDPAGDMQLQLAGLSSLNNPDTGAAGFRVEGPFANNRYVISGYLVSGVTGAGNVGWIKRTTHSAKNFFVGRVSVGPGRYPPSFMEATGTPPSRAADVLSLPVSGFTADEITVAGEFTAPWPDTTTRTAFCLKNGSDKLEMNFASGSSVPVIKLTVGGTEQFGGSAVALTPGQSYKFHVAASKADKLLRWKFAGAAAGSVGPTSPLTATTGFTPAALDVGNAGGSAQLASAIRSLAVIDRAWTAAEGEGFTDPGGVAVLSNAEAALTADVQLATSNTFYDGPSLTLGAGTWLIAANAQYLKTATTASNVTARLHDGSDVLADQTQYHASVTNIALGFGLFRIITLAATTTIKVQMATTVGAVTALMKATAPNNGSTNNATRISAVRIG
jgi:hypothetical protein